MGVCVEGGMCGNVQVYLVCMGVYGYVWDEFSEYILETRVITSADFNTYLIRIFKKRFSQVLKRGNIWHRHMFVFKTRPGLGPTLSFRDLV